MDGFKAGTNVGHWLSQIQDAEKQRDSALMHYRTFMQEEDFKRIASWGMDHVRLPVDYKTFQTPQGEWSEEGLAFVDSGIKWAMDAGLNVVLDLHDAPGFSNTDPQEERVVGENGLTVPGTSLFSDAAKQEQFYRIWDMFSKRYKHYGERLCFELLNEVVTDDPEAWNAIATEAIKRIRAVDGRRTIIIGGRYNNNAGTLFELPQFPDDEGIVYTFHFYDPAMFAMQRATFVSYLANLKTPVSYPVKMSDMTEFMDMAKQYGFPIPDIYKRETLDRSFLLDSLMPVKAFIDQFKREVWCGEYGVIKNADTASELRWYTDFIGILNDMHVGHSLWNYYGFSSILGRAPAGTKYPEARKAPVANQAAIDIISKGW
jgi:hypothetical protein